MQTKVVRIQRLRQPGDKGTHKLYSICGGTKSHKALYDFGVGVGLYYSQLLQLSILCAVLFVLNLPVMMCNASFKRYVHSGCVTTNMPPSICGLSVESFANLTSMTSRANVTAASQNGTQGACPHLFQDYQSGDIGIGDFAQMSGVRLTALQGTMEVLSVIVMFLFLYFSAKVNDTSVKKLI